MMGQVVLMKNKYYLEKKLDNLVKCLVDMGLVTKTIGANQTDGVGPKPSSPRSWLTRYLNGTNPPRPRPSPGKNPLMISQSRRR